MDSDADRRHSSPGFPHSDILGSRPACGFPRLIAASYVLHRLLMPGHSPYTLSSLTITLLLIHMVFLQDLFNCQRTTPTTESSANCIEDDEQSHSPLTSHQHETECRGKRLKRSLVWWSWTELN